MTVLATAGSPQKQLRSSRLVDFIAARLYRYLDRICVLEQQVSWTPRTGLQLDAEIEYRIDEGVRHLASSARPQAPLPSPQSPQDAFSPAYPLDAVPVRCWD